MSVAELRRLFDEDVEVDCEQLREIIINAKKRRSRKHGDIDELMGAVAAIAFAVYSVKCRRRRSRGED